MRLGVSRYAVHRANAAMVMALQRLEVLVKEDRVSVLGKRLPDRGGLPKPFVCDQGQEQATALVDRGKVIVAKEHTELAILHLRVQLTEAVASELGRRDGEPVLGPKVYKFGDSGIKFDR